MHLFSTLFTAQTVGKDFYSDDEIRKAIAWCKASRLQKVYVESFRNGLFVEQRQLEKVRDLFEEEGFLVHGCRAVPTWAEWTWAASPRRRPGRR